MHAHSMTLYGTTVLMQVHNVGKYGRQTTKNDFGQPVQNLKRRLRITNESIAALYSRLVQTDKCVVTMTTHLTIEEGGILEGSFDMAMPNVDNSICVFHSRTSESHYCSCTRTTKTNGLKTLKSRNKGPIASR